ncbi:hypothetical protein L1987_55572 [Smallanthus sonchifolius]|uniref:Uncharacterized protein n=1 Tax=Smallanthus sonchifolius TaxID=185202 RepID=A0ACB9EAM5_9ASTR|nr:hypothetical protein L1987_55572 [Smallanthus sonchifolius]
MEPLDMRSQPKKPLGPRWTIAVKEGNSLGLKITNNHKGRVRIPCVPQQICNLGLVDLRNDSPEPKSIQVWAENPGSENIDWRREEWRAADLEPGRAKLNSNGGGSQQRQYCRIWTREATCQRKGD